MHSISKVHKVERAFLPIKLPQGLGAVARTEITDIYLSPPGDLTTKLRLRSFGDQFELTKKVVLDPTDVSTQAEHTVPLSESEFTLFRQLGGRVLRKSRFTLDTKETETHVDVFRDGLRRLILVEFEFPDEITRDEFLPPDYCTTEVDQEHFIAGAYLAGRSYADIQPGLARLRYEPLEFS